MSLLRRARIHRAAALVAAATSLALTAGLATAPAASAHGGTGTRGHVYVQTNDPAGNAVIVYARSRTGQLAKLATYPTGGTGTGTSLSSQGSVTLSDDGRVLLTVDAGSDEVSAFRVDGDGLDLIGRAPSGGDRPTSVTIHDDLVYVLNAGSSSIAGFRLTHKGLTPVAGSVHALTVANGGAGQIGFTPDGRELIVPLRPANSIDTFAVRGNGSAVGPVNNVSAGPTPFGFDFDTRGNLVISDANAGVAGGSALSSYRVDRDGTLDAITALAPTTQTAACWVVVTADGHYAYTTNAGSGTITGYRVGRDGSLTRLDAGVTATAGSGAGDVALSRDGRFVINVNGGADTITVFAIGDQGRLTPVTTVTGLPAPAVGIAAS